MRWVRLAIGAGVLLAQLAMVARARVHPARYYCWAPFDSINEYRLDVEVAGRELDARAIRRRYRLRQQGVDPRAIQHVFDIVGRYETLHGPGDEARVLVSYRTNGGPDRTWQWPPE